MTFAPSQFQNMTVSNKVTRLIQTILSKTRQCPRRHLHTFANCFCFWPRLLQTGLGCKVVEQ